MTHAEAAGSLATERYLLDEMDEPEREAFEAHFFECEVCAADVRAGDLMRRGVAAGLTEPLSARIAEFPTASSRLTTTLGGRAPVRPVWYRSAALPWAIAATLAVVVGYQAVRPDNTAREDAASEPLAIVTLRPATRGTIPTVSRAGAHVALALDVDAGDVTTLAYQLRANDNRVITSGQTAAPRPGLPLLLVIPTFTLTAEEQYSLTVHEAAHPERIVGEYHFRTER